MRQLLLVTSLFGLFACNQQAENTKGLQNRIDSLEKKLADTYKPGFGEFMSGIQAHHSKLWFAGQNENWKLADFEVHEIMEAIENIQKFQTERKESQMTGMINPALDSINNAIQQRNPVLFKSSYTLLTNTCNNCHHAANFEFNVVKIPDNQPFSNQDFKISK
ncbi:MAG: hypothetical protein KGZ81_04510 [Flavobacteriales bacterium]|nr:hypothetical protein [Flavobacteriales bacterium]